MYRIAKVESNTFNPYHVFFEGMEVQIRMLKIGMSMVFFSEYEGSFHTSYVKKIEMQDDGRMVVHTENSIYHFEKI